MTPSIRKHLTWIGIVLVFGAALWRAVPRERLIASGEPLLLELVPVDPRSLLQGDYMALGYAIEEDAYEALDTDGASEIAEGGGMFSHDGVLVLDVDENGVGTFARLGDDADLAEGALAPNMVAVRFRVSYGTIEIGQQRWFFQEGQAELFEDAEYGEFRVDADGRVILVGMRDERFERLGEPLARW